MAKRKKLTIKEKRMNAEIKKKLQEEGIIPPDKQKLNRKKFVEETIQEWDNLDEDLFVMNAYLRESIAIMLHVKDRQGRISPEAVGVAKCMKLAIRLKAFSDKLKSEHRSLYSVTEQYDFIKDILDA